MAFYKNEDLIKISEYTENRIKLKILDQGFTGTILTNCKGNVAEYFYNFKTVEEVSKWIEEQEKLMKKCDKIELVITDSETNEFIGLVSAREEGDFVVFGLWIAPEKQGRGYAKEAMKTLLHWLKDFSSIKQGLYEAEKNNLSSNKLARTLSFKHDYDYVDKKDKVLYSRYVINFDEVK